LGVVKPAGKDSKDVLVDLPIEQKDINDAYLAEVKVLQEKTPKEVTVISAEQKQEDYYKVS
jgi:chitin synthase